MKPLLCTLLLTLGLSHAVAEETPPVEEAYEIYHYCLYEIEIDDSDENHDDELLSCVNNELSDREYSRFSSLSALLQYIRNYMNGNDEVSSDTSELSILERGNG